MTREEAIARLESLADSGDVEAAHLDADEVLTDLLEELGYSDVVKLWSEVPKWYA